MANLEYTASLRSGVLKQYFPPSRYSSFLYLHLGKSRLVKMITIIPKHLHEYANLQAM